MRNGTKIGLTLIALAWFVASTAVSMIALKAAMRQGVERNEIMDPQRVYRGRVPADVRSQGGLWVWASAGSLHHLLEGAWSQL